MNSYTIKVTDRVQYIFNNDDFNYTRATGGWYAAISVEHEGQDTQLRFYFENKKFAGEITFPKPEQQSIPLTEKHTSLLLGMIHHGEWGCQMFQGMTFTHIDGHETQGK